MKVIKKLLKMHQQKNVFQQQLALIRQSEYFDAEFYLQTYPDVAAAGYSAEEHFLKFGGFEGRKPSERFDAEFYLQQYPDVAQKNINPLVHFIKFGRVEGRKPNKLPNSKLSLSETEQRLQQQIKYQPDNAELYEQLADVLQQQGKHWQEVTALTTAVQLDASAAKRHFKLGMALEVMRRFGDAAEAFQRAVALDGQHSKWFFHLGYALLKSNAEPRLIDHAYQCAIALDTKYDSKRFGIGAFHQVRRDWQQAVACYQEKLSESADDAELYYRLGYAYDRLYDWRNAEHFYTLAIEKSPNMSGWYFRLGFVLERQHKYRQAALAYTHGALNRVKHTPYWYYRSGYTLALAEDYQQACQSYLQMQSKPFLHKMAEPTNDQDTMALNAKLTACSDKFWQAQVGKLTQELALDCTASSKWYALGEAYEQQKNWSAAANAYQQAVNRQDSHTQAWYFRLGYVLTQARQFEAACNAFASCYVVRCAHGVSGKALQSEAVTLLASYTEYYELLPLKQQTILFESFSGKSISCNPYALFLSMYANPDYSEWDYIWVIDAIEKIPDFLKNKPNISFISRGSDRYLRAISEAKYLVNNSGFPPYFLTKKGQKYLATWHGTPLKTLGKQQKYKFFDHKRTERNFLQATHIISPNKHTTDILFDSYDIRRIYTGKLAETGYPRIDLTLMQNVRKTKQLKEQLDITAAGPVVLYAPTWRGTLQDVEIDTSRLESDIEKMSSMGVQVLFRGHSLLEKCLQEVKLNCKVVPAHIDSNELLSIVDVLITDYSSIFFDYIPLNRPIIYYTYDLEEYLAERGMYFDMSEMPGVACSTIEEVQQELQAIMANGAYSLPNYEAAVAKFNYHDDGQASVRTLQFFLKDDQSYVVDPDIDTSIKNVLLFPGGLVPNGITTSFINLIRSVDSKKINPVVIFSPGNIEFNDSCREQFDRIGNEHDFIPRFGNVLMSLEERELRSYADLRHYHGLTEQQHNVLERMYYREFKRLTGHARFERLVHFSGYDEFWTKVFAAVPDIKKSIYLHNDLYAEYTERFPYLNINFSLYNKFDQLISVSELTSEHNKNNLAQRYGVTKSKFLFCDNLQDPADVLARAEDDLESGDVEYFNNGKITFITMGRLSVEKDHAKLIRAFAEVLQHNDNTQLLILGDGPLKLQLEHLCQQRNLQHAVHLLGQRRNPFPLLKRADCFVLSSNHEGQPMVLFEAMILKKTIISTDIVGARSALEGRSGYLVENSEQGLSNGMINFLDGSLQMIDFDITDYQRESLAMFYHKVCQLDTQQ